MCLFLALQPGFQRGRVLATAGVSTLFTNALPIVAGTTIFHEGLPAGGLGVLRVLAFRARGHRRRWAGAPPACAAPAHPRTHTRSDSLETPRSRAISLSVRPLRRYSSTASRRNSGGYGLWKFDPRGMVAHPSRLIGHCRPSAQVSTKPGELQS